jgi:hypothetical protein
MKILPSRGGQQPEEGQLFEFDVLPETSTGGIDIEIELDGRPLRSMRCADPPCHKMKVRVPHRTAGKTLVIGGTSADGDSAVLVLNVGPSEDLPTPMTA